MSRNERLFEVEPGKPSANTADSSANGPNLPPSQPTRNAAKWIAFAAFVAELYFQVKLFASYVTLVEDS